MKKLVCQGWLIDLLGRLLSLTDEEYSEVMALDLSEVVTMRALVRQWVAQEFDSFDAQSQNQLKENLRFYLATGNSELENALASAEAPIPRKYARSYFEAVWIELFKESVHVDKKLDEYEEIESTSEAAKLYKKGYRK